MNSRQNLSIIVLAAAALTTVATALGAQEAGKAAPLFFEGDMVRGPTGGGPVCVLASQYRRKETVVWRVRVRDQAGTGLDDKGLKSLVVELPDGQKFPMKFGPHPARGPATDFFWATSWVIPETHPTGSFAYKVMATDAEGRTHSWEPFKIGISQLTVIP
jgi:hypothetical protein